MEPDHFSFRLYVAGDSPDSTKAVANLSAFYREQLPDQFALEIIDVLRDPARALDDGVLLTPRWSSSRPLPCARSSAP